MEAISKIFSKLSEWIKSFYNYFGVEGIIYILITGVFVSALDVFLPLWLSVVIMIILGISKELIYDLYLGKGEFSKRDLAAYGIGILLACI